VRIATWNVNSVRQRLPRLLPWLDERRPDVVCLQETKLADDAFGELLDASSPSAATRSRSTARPRGTASRSSRAPAGGRRARDPRRAGLPEPEARAVAATCGGLRVVSVYVPNGRSPGSDHYAYKLEWLPALRAMVEPDAAARSSAAT
jgi:exodeoxyribonuclease-3